MIRKSGNRFPDKIMCHETPSLYIRALAASMRRPCGAHDWSGRLATYRIALASARRTGKLPQSTAMELREWQAI
jgi:hypothetical protein